MRYMHVSLCSVESIAGTAGTAAGSATGTGPAGEASTGAGLGTSAGEPEALPLEPVTTGGSCGMAFSFFKSLFWSKLINVDSDIH